jgi:hypothetical protein
MGVALVSGLCVAAFWRVCGYRRRPVMLSWALNKKMTIRTKKM